MPVYLVTVKGETPKEILVDAVNKSVAINHVVNGLVSAEPLTASQVVVKMKQGMPVDEVVPVKKEAPVSAETQGTLHVNV